MTRTFRKVVKMFLIFLVASCNSILLVILCVVKKKAGMRRGKRRKLAMTLKEMLEIQVGLMTREGCPAGGAEIEIARYVKDVGIRCLEEGGYGDADLKRMHPGVLCRYPDMFEKLQ